MGLSNIFGTSGPKIFGFLHPIYGLSVCVEWVKQKPWNISNSHFNRQNEKVVDFWRQPSPESSLGHLVFTVFVKYFYNFFDAPRFKIDFLAQIEEHPPKFWRECRESSKVFFKNSKSKIKKGVFWLIRYLNFNHLCRSVNVPNWPFQKNFQILRGKSCKPVLILRSIGSLHQKLWGFEKYHFSAGFSI